MGPRKSGTDQKYLNVLSPKHNKILTKKQTPGSSSKWNSSIREASIREMGSYSISRDTFEGILPEALEAAKHVQMAKLRQTRSNDASGDISGLTIEQQTTLGTLGISDIRLPLVWNENLCHRYAMFCVITCGDYCIDTDIVSSVDRTMPDVSFDRPFILEKVPPDFKLQLTMFITDLGSDPNLASVRKRLHKSLRSSFRSVSNMKKKFDKTIEFALAATATLTLEDCKGEVASYDLQLESNTLPFFGHVCCRLAMRPACVDEVLEGHKSVRCNGKKLKMNLDGFRLCMDKSGKEFVAVNITETSKIRLGSMGKNRLTLSSDTDDDLALEFASALEYQNWLSALLQKVALAKRWKHTVETTQHLPTLQDPQTPTPHGMALYEATPLQTNRRRIRPIMEVFDDQSGTPMSSTTSLMSLSSSYYGNRGSSVSLQPQLKRKGSMSGWSSTRSFFRFSR